MRDVHQDALPAHALNKKHKTKTNMQTYEFVSPKHPDKICDQIADSILDAYLEKDPEARVAVEVMGGHGKIKVTGEVTSSAEVDIPKIAREVVETDPSRPSGARASYDVEVFISKQSPEIARGVDTGGAGDQGIMVGYACSETENFMPYGYELARNLCRDIYKRYPFDGKTQVTIDKNKVTDVVASFQNTKTVDLETLVREFIKADKYHINPAGEWHIGGFEADSGLSGRKIIIDNYGPYVPVGGGSFSGKDPTKVDRSGAYMARKIAVDLLKERNAKEVVVHLAYVIGVVDPVSAEAELIYLDPQGRVEKRKETITEYDLTPQGIIKLLDLKKSQYQKTAGAGHFGLSDTTWF
ncbi:MAG: methionine adenosyltransferase [Candidatus Colwellbacteria bacterium CG10_big_fil_rev_8_21_14_0_10_42_22]|uniref:methionine adenosyltransferase n=1 Tax=Candidatus Colwellbacteria bacterium CG10_big_fil_rev_8_21_14_0_10_42_22 TaxID=1974540 RepID=A0A2H0VF90_9BACT|nr:MAG: methionine adenosyltransferase [Candidatus Colwellbacteria bacterium CG10_big_fil_rev_8_21_14_0_10_42_22]